LGPREPRYVKTCTLGTPWKAEKEKEEYSLEKGMAARKGVGCRFPTGPEGDEGKTGAQVSGYGCAVFVAAGVREIEGKIANGGRRGKKKFDREGTMVGKGISLRKRTGKRAIENLTEQGPSGCI